MTVGRTVYLPIHWHGWFFSRSSCRQIYHAWMVCVVGKTRFFWSRVLHVKMVTKAIPGATILAEEFFATGRPCWSLEDQVADIRSGPQNRETAQSTSGPWQLATFLKISHNPIQGWWTIQSKEDGSSWYLYISMYIYIYFLDPYYKHDQYSSILHTLKFKSPKIFGSHCTFFHQLLAGSGRHSWRPFQLSNYQFQSKCGVSKPFCHRNSENSFQFHTGKSYRNHFKLVLWRSWKLAFRCSLFSHHFSMIQCQIGSFPQGSGWKWKLFETTT